MVRYIYNHFNLFLSVALTLPRPLSKKCKTNAKKLEKAVEGSKEQAKLLKKLEQIPAWNDWVRVYHTFISLGAKPNSPRNLFRHWTYALKDKIHLMDDAYAEQYHMIADAIDHKAAGKEYNDIDIRALLNNLLDGYDHNDSEEEEEY
jgi:hypothetical protein